MKISQTEALTIAFMKYPWLEEFMGDASEQIASLTTSNAQILK